MLNSAYLIITMEIMFFGILCCLSKSEEDNHYDILAVFFVVNMLSAIVYGLLLLIGFFAK